MGARELLVDEDNSLAERMRRGRWRQIRGTSLGWPSFVSLAEPLSGGRGRRSGPASRIAGVPKSMTAIKQCNFNDGTALRG